MIGELYFTSNGSARPAYLLDCLGNLVRCSAEGNPDSLIPFAVSMVASASDLSHPYPWTDTVEKIVSRLEFVADALPQISSLYPANKLQKSEYPFVQPKEPDESSAVIEEAIGCFPDLSSDQAAIMRGMLAENGVFEIAYSQTFNANIHEATGDGICVAPIAYVSTGWMSSMRIYRKALIRSA
jgi:hypothetical protein